jgi:hypothetical protein
MKKFRNWLAYRLATVAKRLKVREDDDGLIELGIDDDCQSNSFDFESCSRLHLSIHYLKGGQIVEVTSRDPNKNNSNGHTSRTSKEHHGVYLIGEGTDLSERVREIVFNETLRIG